MKMLNSFFFVALLALVVACGKAPAGEKVEAGEAQTTTAGTEVGKTLKVDVAKSTVNWTGAKAIGNDQHTGTINISEGQLTVNNGELMGGSFVLDMNSIKNTDMQGGKAADLEGHLKTGDFFEVETHPTATFVITEVKKMDGQAGANHQITGNFTMKGITKSISIPANVTLSDAGLSATTPDFTIDRTQWNVMFKAGILGTAKDEAIRDEIGLKISLSAM